MSKYTYKVEFAVNAVDWETVRTIIGEHWFTDDEPQLTRHPKMATNEREFFAFESNFAEDIGWVLALPEVLCYWAEPKNIDLFEEWRLAASMMMKEV